MKKKRIFIGSFITDEILKKEYGKIRKELGNVIKGKWIPFENLHITYKFLGATQEDKIEEITKALDKYLNKDIQCNLTIKGIGAFPSVYAPNVVFFKVYDNSEILNELYYFVQNSLQKIGFEKDTKRFIPHITIKRPKQTDVKQFFKMVNQLEEKVFGKQTSIQLNIIESVLLPDGARYKKIQ